LGVAAGFATAADPAWADVNQTPIAVPLIGDQGAGSPYPSTIHVTARGGPTQTAQPYIILHAVTHPCPEDLAVLLVHNGTEKYLLMSHAGGCRALQGTDLWFAAGGLPIPDTQPSTPAYNQVASAGISNYGSVPVFPAPAPAGPYTTTWPNTFVEGTWDLYVMDTGAGNRGVIAAGWSINYPTYSTWGPAQSLPVAIPALGAASAYPITFDLSSIPAGVKVWDIRLQVTLSHTFPDDVNLVLQAPNGNAVLVMSNAGGGNDITSVNLQFQDDAGASLPDSTQIVTGTYKPSAFGTFVPPPNPPGTAPLPPYGATLSTLNGQDARGIWKLWVYDDTSLDSGSIGGVDLTVFTELVPLFSIDTPTTGTTYTANTPFLHLEGEIEDLVNSPHSATWRTLVGGNYYASGPMIFTPGSQVVKADIPMQKGTNFVQVYVYNTALQSATDDLDVTVNEFVYTLSEGATGGFFDLDVTMGNPTAAAAPVSIDFLPEHSATVPFSGSVAANSPLQLHGDDYVPGDSVSTIVHSTNAVPLAVERTMSWDSTGYGGSGGTAISPNTRWIFAEGSQGYFDTFVLLANDNATDANVTVKFLVEGGSPVNYPVVVPAHKRLTIYAGDIAAIVNTSFGIDITATQPITAERSMYFPHGGPRTFEGGHESAGANATSTHWFLAEGATGPFFECFILLSNPTASIAHATLTYLLPTGETVPQSVTVPANGRTTIDVEGVDPRLANAAVSTTITSDVGIIVERSMYWPDISLGWKEAHNSVGVTDPALRWGISDGRIGGARAYQTYILLANPNTVPAEVQVRFLKAGAAPVARTLTLPATSRTNIASGDLVADLGEGLFSADVKVLNFQPIVVEKAMYWNSGTEVWAAGTGVVATPLPPQ
jgi:subtilisin-like proprotein convertase family protein